MPRALRSAAAAVPIEPARLRSAHHQLRRRQHVREDPHGRSADAADGRRPLGERLRRRYRQHEARRLRHAVSRQAGRAEGALRRPRIRRRDGRLPLALHVRPEPARDEHRHHAPRVHCSSPYRSHACRRDYRHRGGAQRRTADAHDFRRCAGVGAVAAPRIRPGLEGRRRGIGSGARRTGAGQSRVDHMGRDVAGLLRCDAPRDSTGGRLARREQQGRTVRVELRFRHCRPPSAAPSFNRLRPCCAAC